MMSKPYIFKPKFVPKYATHVSDNTVFFILLQNYMLEKVLYQHLYISGMTVFSDLSESHSTDKVMDKPILTNLNKDLYE